MFQVARHRLCRAFLKEAIKPSLKPIRCLNYIPPLAGNASMHQQSTALFINQSRYKSKKSKSKGNQQSDSEGEEDVEDLDDEIADKGTKLMTLKLTSMRLDGLLKSGLGIARNKIEVMFYESKIRVNGEKVPKKGATVYEGDEIDIIRGINTENPKFLNVGRVEILSAAAKDDYISVKVRRFKTLTIENYADPWKGS